MLYCAICLKEMRCKKTGATIYHGSGHCRSGDLFECPDCGNLTVNCNENAYYVENFIDTITEQDVVFDVTKSIPKEKEQRKVKLS